MDSRMTSLVIQQYPEIIVGVKIGHYRGSEWTPFDRAMEAGTHCKSPTSGGMSPSFTPLGRNT